MVRARHPLEGRSLELAGWMRRGRLELLLVLPDGTRSLIPAVWTDLEGAVEPPAAGTMASLEELLATRRVLDGLLGTAAEEECGQ